jgi:hypothetical protein
MSQDFPDNHDFELLDSYLARLQSGEKADREELLRQRPELESALRCIETLEKIMPRPLIAHWELLDDRGLILHDPAKKRGGIAGATIVIIVTFLALFPSFYDVVTPLRTALFESLVFSLVLGSLGFVAGRSGAKGERVYRAILSGAVLFAVACAVAFTTYLLLGMNIETARRYWALAVQWTVIFAVAGGLVSGLGAIIARDYQCFRRLRLVPQFTLQELFVFSSLLIVIFSMIFSRSFFRMLVG